uniref:Uncharacterized protein n=1 Tax=Iconisemion striatum TaxID=60296 RepID=A0A1A7YVV3_9TELE
MATNACMLTEGVPFRRLYPSDLTSEHRAQTSHCHQLMSDGEQRDERNETLRNL